MTTVLALVGFGVGFYATAGWLFRAIRPALADNTAARWLRDGGMPLWLTG